MNARHLCSRARTLQCSRSLACRASNAKFLVGGNWKCNGTISSVDALVRGLNDGEVPSSIDVVVAPTFVHLRQVADSIRSPYQVAAQNCWTGAGGAFTGEVTADMLADMRVPWVITGHSERRDYNKESNEFVAEKTKYAVGKDRKVIVCVGETLAQREAGELWDHLGGQLKAVADVMSEAEWSSLVIAYEPIWAIGTGEVATPAQAQEVHAFLRKWVNDNVGLSVADQLRILYGGSVKGANSGELAREEDIDGFLVGGASLDAQEFLKICQANEQKAASAA